MRSTTSLIKTALGALSNPLGTISSSLASNNTNNTNQSNTDPTIQGTLTNTSTRINSGFVTPADSDTDFPNTTSNTNSNTISSNSFKNNLQFGQTGSLFNSSRNVSGMTYVPVDPMGLLDPTYNSVIVTGSNISNPLFDNLPQTYVQRNDAGVLQMNTESERTDLAVPLILFYPQAEVYNKIIDTSFQYFVEAESILDTLLPEDQEALRFEERFIDNIWVEGGQIGFLVEAPTKFRSGNTVKVVQDEGATVDAYDGVWTVRKIVRNQIQISGSSYDSVQTNCPFVSNTPTNPGTLILF